VSLIYGALSKLDKGSVSAGTPIKDADRLYYRPDEKSRLPRSLLLVVGVGVLVTILAWFSVQGLRHWLVESTSKNVEQAKAVDFATVDSKTKSTLAVAVQNIVTPVAEIRPQQTTVIAPPTNAPLATAVAMAPIASATVVPKIATQIDGVAIAVPEAKKIVEKLSIPAPNVAVVKPVEAKMSAAVLDPVTENLQAKATEKSTEMSPELNVNDAKSRVELPKNEHISVHYADTAIALKGGKSKKLKSTKLSTAAVATLATPATAQQAQDALKLENKSDAIASLTIAIKRAIQANKKEEVESLMAQLGKQLPAESITLLRLRAWQKMQSGDQQEALVLYQQIVDRIPDDETAAINLALLHWKAGNREEARRLMLDLTSRHPESENVQSYGRQFGVVK
jgi:Flp pilus assembly protein TadD